MVRNRLLRLAVPTPDPPRPIRLPPASALAPRQSRTRCPTQPRRQVLEPIGPPGDAGREGAACGSGRAPGCGRSVPGVGRSCGPARCSEAVGPRSHGRAGATARRRPSAGRRHCRRLRSSTELAAAAGVFAAMSGDGASGRRSRGTVASAPLPHGRDRWGDESSRSRAGAATVGGRAGAVRPGPARVSGARGRRRCRRARRGAVGLAVPAAGRGRHAGDRPRRRRSPCPRRRRRPSGRGGGRGGRQGAPARPGPAAGRRPGGRRVDAAGGALPGADIALLNLARKVVDGELILVGVTPPPGAGGDGRPAARGGVRRRPGQPQHRHARRARHAARRRAGARAADPRPPRRAAAASGRWATCARSTASATPGTSSSKTW